jgi:hypothetical protein
MILLRFFRGCTERIGFRRLTPWATMLLLCRASEGHEIEIRILWQPIKSVRGIQIHLRTAVVLMFVSSGLIWLNLPTEYEATNAELSELPRSFERMAPSVNGPFTRKAGHFFIATNNSNHKLWFREWW